MLRSRNRNKNKNKNKLAGKAPAAPMRRGMPFSEQQKIARIMGGEASKFFSAPRINALGRKRRPQRAKRVGGFAPNQNVALNGKKGRLVQEDEYIGEVLGSNSATVPVRASYPLNPGQASTFPWLATQAKSWEQWECLSCEFYIKPEVSPYATGGQTGKVIMVHKYNAADGPPATKQQAEDTEPHADGMAYTPISLKLDPSLMHPAAAQAKKLVRPAGLPGGGDITNYDGGNLTVMTLNNGVTTAVGELHVRYIFRLLTPVLEGATYVAPTNNQVAMFQSTTAEAIATTGVPVILALATALTNGVGAVNTAGSVVLPVGNYLIDAFATGVNTNATATHVLMDIRKDGTSVLPVTGVGATGGAVANNDAVTVDANLWVSSDGTNAFTMQITVEFAAGTQTAIGGMRVTAM